MTNFAESFIGTALAQTTSPTPAVASPTGGLTGMLLPMVLVFGIFYLLLLRPQAKEKKKHATMLGALKKGDEVVTTAGIHGRVVGVQDNIATLELAENLRIKMEKNQIARLRTASP